jgi:hypothetical protein
MQSFSTRLLDLFAKSFVVRRLRISLNTLAPHASVFAKTCCATACRPTAWIGLQAELRIRARDFSGIDHPAGKSLHLPSLAPARQTWLNSSVSTSNSSLVSGDCLSWWRLARDLLIRCFHLIAFSLALSDAAFAIERTKAEDLWSLKPVVRPPLPAGTAPSTHPIDAFLGEFQREKGVQPLGRADKLTWLRRVHLDLVGLPPSIEEQDRYLADESATAEQGVVERLLASEQHGVRYGRRWLDVLRYADQDEFMPSESGISLWRDWVIDALNQDLPYDQFVRAQVCGNRAPRRQVISPAGHLTRVEPRLEDVFALGFLARGALTQANADQELALAAVDTVSLAFMGLTVGCAKCHDHLYDPISQKDFYSMKALFDPLVLRPMDLATPEQIVARGRKMREYEDQLNPVVEAMRRFVEPFHSRLYEERLQMMTPEVQSAIRKPERQRNAAEQKLYEDYYPILRIDPPKIKGLMNPDQIKVYDDYLKQINGIKPPEPLRRFWTVAEDSKRLTETNYVLVTGDPQRPKLQQPVNPGFPFAPATLDFRAGRRETFVDWLTAPENPLFARVVVNRIWAWHFGAPLHASVSDFGTLGGVPVHPKLLDWLAAEFVSHNYSMKWLHRFIVTSEAYRRSSAGDRPAEQAARALDPANHSLWRFPLRRLEAEPIYDSLWAAAGTLDLSLGGPAFDEAKNQSRDPEKAGNARHRRAAFMSRGYRSSSDAMPDSLETFDAEDGRAVCSRRNETVTPTQALYLMNHASVETASSLLASRLERSCGGDVDAAIKLGYRWLLGRAPQGDELTQAQAFASKSADWRKGFAWMLLNLDEFLYVR